jgi:hypothetical protein
MDRYRGSLRACGSDRGALRLRGWLPTPDWSRPRLDRIRPVDRGSRRCLRIGLQHERLADRLAGQNEPPMLAALVAAFATHPCSKCGGNQFVLVDVTPNGRSIGGRCRYRGRQQRFPAVGDVSPFVEAWTESKREARTESRVVFSCGAVELNDRSSREPIPSSVRHAVWHRDGGKCVQCVADRELQFDHIIPVSRGVRRRSRTSRASVAVQSPKISYRLA